MQSLTHLQNSYVNSLKSLTKGTSRRKVLDEKKNDEIGSWKSAFAEEKKIAKQAFPITQNMFLLSLLFWIVMGILIYFCITYGLLFARITREEDLVDICPEQFSKTKDDNMKKINNYTLGDAGPYILRLQSNEKEDYPHESEVLPPILTAVTSSQFYELQGLIDHIKEEIEPAQKDLKLIVYDLGLYATERKLLERYCHCEVRDLDYEQYPSHVAQVTNFAWRPIILQLLLKEFGAVMYMEPNSRFKTASSPNYLRLRGSRSFYLWDPLVFAPVVSYTERKMFDFFEEKRCVFTDCSLITPEAIVLYRTQVTWLELMKPWLKCALNVDCIAPKHAQFKGCFHMRQPRTTGCHRYDMSALSIIVNRASQYTIDAEKMVSFRLTYTEQAPEKASFPEQPWTYSEILAIILVPVFAVVIYKFYCSRRR